MSILDASAIFVRRRPENEGWIQHLHIRCDDALPAVVPLADAYGALQRAAFVLGMLGRYDRALAAIRQALAQGTLDPARVEAALDRVRALRARLPE